MLVLNGEKEGRWSQAELLSGDPVGQVLFHICAYILGSLPDTDVTHIETRATPILPSSHIFSPPHWLLGQSPLSHPISSLLYVVSSLMVRPA